MSSSADAASSPKTSSPFNLAIFGDLHGRILLAFQLVRRWQEEHGETIHHILSVGDIGVFRSKADMDKASRRFAEKYPEELGFSKFFHARDPCWANRIRRVDAADEALKDLSCSLFFVPGNHEDHAYLRKVRHDYASDLGAPVAVDLDWEGIANEVYSENDFRGYGRIFCLPEGPVVTLDGPVSEETWEPAAGVNIRAINGLDKHTPKEAWESPGRSAVDILLTHEAPRGRFADLPGPGLRGERGNEKLDEFIERVTPKWHFFGHHHIYCPEVCIETVSGSRVRSVGLNQLMFASRQSIISHGAFGILRVDAGAEREWDFAIVDDPWYRELRYSEVKWCL